MEFKTNIPALLQGGNQEEEGSALWEQEDIAKNNFTFDTCICFIYKVRRRLHISTSKLFIVQETDWHLLIFSRVQWKGTVQIPQSL